MSAADEKPPHADPRSPEFQARAWRIFDEKRAAMAKWQDAFGNVLPIMHTEIWGQRLVGVGSKILSVDPLYSFRDFLRAYLTSTLGAEWIEAELRKPASMVHPLARWHSDVEEQIRRGPADDKGRHAVTEDGALAGCLNVAYDLLVIEQNVRYTADILKRLKDRSHFVGVRYELLVAATCARADCELTLEDEGDNRSAHPEFIATHRKTGFAMAVECKARNRRYSDRAPERAGIDDLLADAARKAPLITPFVVFVDVAMPPEPSHVLPSWTEEVKAAARAVPVRAGDGLSPFDLVVFTNFPHRYGAPGEPDPPPNYVGWAPGSSRVSTTMHDALVRAVNQYGHIPDWHDSPR